MSTAREPLEKDIQSQCLAYLRLRGVLSVRVNSGAVKVGGRFVRFNDGDGTSDVLACLPPDGRFAAVEVKRPGNAPTEKQAAFLALVESRGGLALVVTGLDDMRAKLAAAGYDLG